ncbi:MAG: FkbM family methyltransferase [Acidobacteriota bacterium]
MSLTAHLAHLRTSGLDPRSYLPYLAARWLRSRFCPPLPPAARTIAINWRGTPLTLRLGSTDILVFQELFLEHHYGRLAGALAIAAPAGRPLRILDLGAYTGLSAAGFAALYPGCELLCLEPEPENFRLLEHNLAAARLSALALRAFAGDTPGSGYIRDAGAGEWAFELSRAPAGLPTPVYDVPTLLAARAWDAVDLIKCNIEGAEEPLFRNCRSWIRRARSLIVELHPPYDLAAFAYDLSRNGAAFEIRETVAAGDHTVCAVALWP